MARTSRKRTAFPCCSIAPMVSSYYGEKVGVTVLTDTPPAVLNAGQPANASVDDQARRVPWTKAAMGFGGLGSRPPGGDAAGGQADRASHRRWVRRPRQPV